MEEREPQQAMRFARAQVVTAARIAGIDAIDAPFPAYRDRDGYRRSAIHAGLLGFDGKWAIHPDQIAIANKVFSPTPEEVRVAPGAPSRRTAPPRPGAWGRSGATAGSWTPPTCGSPRTSSTRRRGPRVRGPGDDVPARLTG
jgi:HpcH/HpaI aldolase/citrate lyase family